MSKPLDKSGAELHAVKVALAGGEEAWGTPILWIPELLLADSLHGIEFVLAGRDADYVFVNQNTASVTELASELMHIPVRVFIATEAVCPDFNLFDYAIGFDDLIFPNRYQQFHPLHFFERYLKYGSLEKDQSQVQQALKIKKRFCDFIYSNPHANPARDKFFDILSNKEFVHSAGSYRPNIESSIVRSSWDSDWRRAKVEFQSESLFSFAFENACHVGYTTEKIITSMLAMSLPIYWGNPSVGEFFNSKSFINCHDYETFSQVADKVYSLRHDAEAYRETLEQPWMTKANHERFHSMKNSVAQFLYGILTKPVDERRLRGNGTWNDYYETTWRQAFKKNQPDCSYLSPRNRFVQKLRKCISKVVR